MTGRRAAALALLAYALLSLALWGPPVLGHLGSRVIAADQIDSSAYMWFLSWWPHALGAGVNPFVTHAIFVPQGYNLAWVASMPLASLVLTPLTLGFDPAVSYNVLELAAPALSAWTGFLLCRHVCGRTTPALVGGYVFGFSPYLFAQLQGAPQLAFVALVPVIVLLVLARLEGKLGERAFVALLALTLAAQFAISVEVAVTATLMGALALAAGVALSPELRPRAPRLVGLLAGAYAGMAILVSPLLVYMLAHSHTHPATVDFSTDPLALVVPGHLLELATHHSPAGEPAYENAIPYLGLPLLALLAVFAWRWRRRTAARVVVVAGLIAFVLSLGSHLVIGGHHTGVPLPWIVFAHLPGVRYAVPVRLAVYVSLAAAVAVAMWLSWRPGWWGWALVLAGLAFIVPNVGNAAWHTDASDPPFFSTGAYRTYLSRSDVVLTVPTWGPNMRWQARTRFGFQMAGGYVGAFPVSYSSSPVWQTLISGRLTAAALADVRQFVAAKRVTAIVIDDRYLGPWSRLFAGLGARPRQVGGVMFYRLAGRGPSGRGTP